jgi:hypothetical protein
MAGDLKKIAEWVRYSELPKAELNLPDLVITDVRTSSLPFRPSY